MGTSGEESTLPMVFCFLPELLAAACPLLPGSGPWADSRRVGNAAAGLQQLR